MKHGSLFSGIGGFDLAAEWMGWENVFHCEWMEFPRKVLDYYWPDSDSFTDICKTDFKKYANQIDILTGGFPCQPFSMAGKRKGTDDERYLWGEMLRAIQEIKPTFVIAENVAGILSIDDGLVFEQVCLDLEAEGYELQPFIIPAAAKNAPHRRDRVWFVGIKNATNTNSRRLERAKEVGRNGINVEWKSKFRNATNPDGNGLNQCNGNNEIHASQGRQYAQCDFEQSDVDGNVTDTEIERLERLRRKKGGYSELCGRYNGLQDWENFPTQSPICGGDDGLPTELDGITFSKWRSESIKGYGNAIVPQVAYQIFRAIEQTI